MDYTLVAKQLKDAGFPQKHDWHDNDIVTVCVKPDCMVKKDYPYSPDPDEPCHPTLSELIEACGKDFSSLLKHEWDGSWDACSSPRELMARAETPEEAVAKLWLELNTPPKQG